MRAFFHKKRAANPKPAPQNPTTLIELMDFIPDEKTATLFLTKFKFEDGVIVCWRCGSTNIGFLTTRPQWRCRECGKTSSIKTGSIIEHSAIPLREWLLMIWLMANTRSSVSSRDMSKKIGITQTSAWRVMQKIRSAM